MRSRLGLLFVMLLATGCGPPPSESCATDNGGCDVHATCSDAAGVPACACDDGYIGDGQVCVPEVVTDPCSVGNGGCDAHASCAVTDDVVVCACEDGYAGDGLTCAAIPPIPECATDNGGCDVHATCALANDIVVCTCEDGYGGDGATCAPIDRCATDHGGCAPDATCTSTGPGERTCACPDGSEGDGITCVELAVCGALPPLAGDVGQPCDAPGDDTCPAASAQCASDQCLADGDGHGYCTTACDPADALACPSGFACVASSCESAGVCERIEQLASTTCLAQPADATPTSTPWYATLGNGSEYMGVHYGHNDFFYIHMAGDDTWYGGPGLWNHSFDPSIELTRFTDDDGSTYVLFNNGIMRFTDDGLFQQYATGAWGAFALFRTPGGAIRLIAPEEDPTTIGLYERVADQQWTRLGSTTIEVLGEGALEDHGFITRCGSGLCMSDDGLTLTPIALPAGESIGALATSSKPRYAGTSAAFFVLSEAGSVLRCNPTACTRDEMPAAYHPTAPATMWQATGFLRAGDATYLRLGYLDGGRERTTTLRLDGGCWQPVAAPEQSLISWGGSDGLLHYADGSNLCAATVR